MLRAIGLMSGTSADGIDAALIETDGEHVASTGASLTLPMPAGLRERILSVMADPVRAEHDGLADLEARGLCVVEGSAIISAYIAGATDVHNFWADGGSAREADFTEAAHDYAASVRAMIAASEGGEG